MENQSTAYVLYQMLLWACGFFVSNLPKVHVFIFYIHLDLLVREFSHRIISIRFGRYVFIYKTELKPILRRKKTEVRFYREN
jgi:hypothetical protein